MKNQWGIWCGRALWTDRERPMSFEGSSTTRAISECSGVSTPRFPRIVKLARMTVARVPRAYSSLTMYTTASSGLRFVTSSSAVIACR